MNPTQAGLESTLHAAYTARDFDAWLEARAVYADFLEEADHALARMARCPVRCHAVRMGAGKRPWMWRLYFDFAESWGKPRPRWWAIRRVNAVPMLGLPPYTLRCKGWEEDTRTLRFTVVWRPHTEQRYISGRRQNLAQGYWKPVARDTDLHPAGFAAAFWTTTFGAVREITPEDRRRVGGGEQKELFT